MRFPRHIAGSVLLLILGITIFVNGSGIMQEAYTLELNGSYPQRPKITFGTLLMICGVIPISVAVATFDVVRAIRESRNKED